MIADEFECTIIRLSKGDIIRFCMENNFIQRELICAECGTNMKLVKYTRNNDGYAWRCMHKSCTRYKKYISVRTRSFFKNPNIDVLLVLRIVCKYAVRQPYHSIANALAVKKNTLLKVLNNIRSRIPRVDFRDSKLGGPGFIVQIDETMLNFKVKSHRGRSPSNRTDCLCIVEVNTRITRAYACSIPDKKAETLIPIICSQVASNSIIHTDEHRSYACLLMYFTEHQTVCHKYEFINRTTLVNTQDVQSFNNELKLESKRRKGILTVHRDLFLNEFCYYFNNRDCYFETILNLIKIQ